MNLDFSDIKILLIGDFMIDHYIIGTSERISPEAPVPVIIPEREYSIPGGTGNVALNLRALGAKVDCLGEVGDDEWGKKLVSILNDNGANTDDIVLGHHKKTIVKERIYLREANRSWKPPRPGRITMKEIQLARIDRDSIYTQFFSLGKFNNYDLDQYDACIFSDYNKGTIRNLNYDTCPQLANTSSLVFVDPKKSDFSLLKRSFQ